MSDCKRAVIYARFSSDGQRDVSIDDQVKAASDWASEHGVKIVGRYCDYAISGRTDERPEFRRMVADKKLYDAVVLWNTDRFARNMFDAFRYLGDFIQAGKSIYFVTQPELNEDSPVRMLLYSIYAWKDQRYSEDLSANVTRGMRGKAERCEYLGYQTFGYSHEGDQITIDEHDAELVRYVFDRFCEGDTILSLANYLAEKGVRTRNGGKPTYNFVDNILKNERYFGTYIWKDVRIEGGMPKIISRAKFDEAQIRRESRCRRDRKHDYFLTGRLVCATCGKFMHGMSVHGNGGNYTYYCCKGKGRACRGTVPMEQLNRAVIQSVRDQFADYDTCARAVESFFEVQAKYELQTDVEGLKRKLKKLDKKRANLINAVAEGLPFEEANGVLHELDEQKRAVEQRIAEAQTERAAVSPDLLFELFDEIRQGQYSDQAILEAFVSAVYLFEDKFVVVTNLLNEGGGIEEIEVALEQEKTLTATGTVRAIPVGCPQLGLTQTRVLYLETGLGLVVGF